MELRVRNVNGALKRGIELMNLPGVPITVKTRGTTSLEFPEPVLTYYQRPWERVLFSPARDANPFFHLFESLWMLAGRNDVGFVAAMVKRMADFSDNGWLMQGAYGWRWRRAFGVDQVDTIVDLIKRDPETRRAVIAMWDVRHDMSTFGAKAAKDAPLVQVGGLKSKDIPCNTTLYFKPRSGKLQLTICCRSNDIIWGAYGANAVHFSILQEYVAGKCGLLVGPMIQISDSYHAYTEGGSAEVWKRVVEEWHTANEDKAHGGVPVDLYAEGCDLVPLNVNDDWDADLARFFDRFDAVGIALLDGTFATKWWNVVAKPIWNAWVTRQAFYLDECEAEDWDFACRAWIQRHPKAVSP